MEGPLPRSELKAEDRVGRRAPAEGGGEAPTRGREAAKAAAEPESDGEDDGEEDGEDEDEDGEDGEEALVSDDDAEDASDSDEGELLSGEEGSGEEGSDEEGEEGSDDEEASGSEEEEASGSEEFDPEEEDEYGRVVDPTTGRKRKFIQPALTLEQKRAMADRAVSEAEAKGERAPKVRKNGILSLSELRRRHKTAAKERRAREAEEAETNAAQHSDSEEDLVEHTRVLEPEDFRRIKALREAGKLDAAMDRVGAKKAKDTAAEEMRRMLRLADRSNVADRRVNPDALMAVGLRKAHDKETRVASVMAGREDRGEFGASQARKNKSRGHQQRREEGRGRTCRSRRGCRRRGDGGGGSAKFGAAKAVKDKQFKGSSGRARITGVSFPLDSARRRRNRCVWYCITSSSVGYCYNGLVQRSRC